jgi:hypothetical protein
LLSAIWDLDDRMSSETPTDCCIYTSELCGSSALASNSCFIFLKFLRLMAVLRTMPTNIRFIYAQCCGVTQSLHAKWLLGYPTKIKNSKGSMIFLNILQHNKLSTSTKPSQYCNGKHFSSRSKLAFLDFLTFVYSYNYHSSGHCHRGVFH